MPTNFLTGEKTLKRAQMLTEYSIYALVFFYAISKALLLITFTVALVTWLFAKFRLGDFKRIRMDFMAVTLIAFLALSIASFFVSDYPNQSFRGIIKQLRVVMLFLIIYDTFRTPEKFKKLLGVGIFSALVIFSDAVYQYGFGQDLFRARPYHFVDKYIRLTGPFGEHTLFASFCMIWLGVVTSLFLKAKNLTLKQRILAGLLMLLGAFGLFHTLSRGAWLAFALALFLFFLLQRQKLFLVALAAVIGTALVVLPKELIVHPDYYKKEQSLLERVVLWDRALNVIKARPLLGTGINTYAVAHQQFDKSDNWRVKNYYAHNSYLQLAAERGLPALVFLILFLSSFFIKCFRALSRKEGDPELRAVLMGLMTGLCGILFLALVDTVFEPVQTAMLMWLVLGMSLAAVHLIETERKGIL